MKARNKIAAWTAVLLLTLASAASPCNPGDFVKSAQQPADTKQNKATLSVQLLSPDGKPLERQSLYMNPVTEGYPEVRPPVALYADLAGRVVGSLAPGKHRFIVNQEWTAPTLFDFDVPPQGLTTAAKVLPRDFPSGRADLLQIDVALRTKDGERWPTLLDVTVTNNTAQPYTLTATDLSLFDFIYRVFPPESQSHKGEVVPARGEGRLSVTLDWTEYYRHGLWCSARMEILEMPGDIIGYSVRIANCLSRHCPLVRPEKEE